MKREQFVDLIASMAGEVWDFHERWGFGSFNDQQTAIETLRQRIPVQREEVRELKDALEQAHPFTVSPEVEGEAGDVLFVAIGNIEAMSRWEQHAIAAVDGTNAKNAAKTPETHGINRHGKLVPYSKPEKWL